ncbi:transposase [Candidatus Parcubacteria bacterium]|nr:transposase [Candidatus Parcubacteria bacterium]
MSVRNTLIAPGEYYHICNRGVSKQIIFHNSDDYNRFLFLILYFQSSTTFDQIGRIVKQFVQSPALDIRKDVINKRTVELLAFCIMPNHFHLIIKEVEDNGVINYLQRILTAYSKYYNTKYEKSGHVFQGPYRSIHISDDRQFLHTSAYIHRNPRELRGWINREDKYPWSSYQDYIGNNRWSDLLQTQALLDGFKNKREYKKFVETSRTKITEEDLGF